MKKFRNRALIYRHDLTPTAKTLRKDMTRHEKQLWYKFLNTYPIKIYRQRVIGDYIADFYCPRAKLVIELDGSQHYTGAQVEYDERRTKYMNDVGISVIRFINQDIDENFYGVCATINREIEEILGIKIYD